MDESFTIPAEESGDTELDPRIQVELEQLNAATHEINNLETELEDSNTTFRLLLGEASRRLQGLSKRLGSCVDKSRPYYEAVESAVKARSECQKAAVAYQRASELHAAAKETVSLAEQRFISKQNEWQFDSAWQDMLNHAILKVTDAEKKKTESGREHEKKAKIFDTAERKVTQLEDNLKRSIVKSRLYFEEKKLCEEQLKTQKDKISQLQQRISNAKLLYAQSLRNLEVISEEIHRRRGEYLPKEIPVGPREPGVGAEKDSTHEEISLNCEVDTHSTYSHSSGGSKDIDDDLSLQELRSKVRELALKPIDDTQGETDEAWALELNETINKLDHLLMVKENNQQKRSKLTSSGPSSLSNNEAVNLSSMEKGDNSTVAKKETEAISEKVVTPIKRDTCMMSLDVVSLARDMAGLDKESYLKGIIEEKSPSHTYTESTPEINDSPDEILMVECEENNGSTIVCMSNTQN